MRKKYFKKDFFKLMNNAVFTKTMENIGNHKDIKLATNEERSSYLVSEPNYNKITFFFRKSISNKNEENKDTH